MTISSTNRKAGPFVGNGSASVFAFSFRVFSASDLEVVRITVATGAETTLTINSGYTVTLNPDQNSNPGGSITLVGGALASGYNLIITSNIANLQPTDLTNQGGFYPEVITDALDRATIQIQQLDEHVGRTLSYPITDPTLGTELPALEQRKGTVLAFNATTGAPEAGPTIAAIGTVSGNTSDINTVAANISDVNIVAGNIGAVTGAKAMAQIYQGAKASDPTLRNAGTALETGDLYYNTSNNRMRVYETGTGWIDYEATAQTAATTATTQAGIATTQANIATAQALTATAGATTATSAKTIAEAARDAALMAKGIYATTDKALSKGVASVALTAAGSGGTNGTFDLVFSGGGGTGAAGRFTVSGGAVVASNVIITSTGDSYTSAPTVSFANSAGLTGATGLATIANNVDVGEHFFSLNGSIMILYTVAAGPVVTERARYALGYSDTTSPWLQVVTDKAGVVIGGFNEQGQFVLPDKLNRGVAQRLEDARAQAYVAAAMPLGMVPEANLQTATTVMATAPIIDTALAGDAWASYKYTVYQKTATAQYRFPTLMQLRPGKMLLFACDLLVPTGINDVNASRIVVSDIDFNFKTRSFTVSAPRIVVDDRAFTSGSSVAAAFGHSPILVRTGPNKGRIYLLYTSNKDAPATIAAEKPYLIYSDDNGQTWSAPTMLAAATGHLDNTYSYGTGMKAIQLKYGAAKGRLIFPWYAYTSAGVSNCYSVYSDNGGSTWVRGAPFGPNGSSEPTYAEHVDGTVYAMLRVGTKAELWKSTDGALTFTLVDANFLTHNGVQVAMGQTSESSPNVPRLVVSWPANPAGRYDLKVATSYDGWATKVEKMIEPFSANNGRAGYSGIDAIGEDYVMIAWEDNQDLGFVYDSIVIQAVNIKYLLS